MMMKIASPTPMPGTAITSSAELTRVANAMMTRNVRPTNRKYLPDTVSSHSSVGSVALRNFCSSIMNMAGILLQVQK